MAGSGGPGGAAMGAPGPVGSPPLPSKQSTGCLKGCLLAALLGLAGCAALGAIGTVIESNEETTGPDEPVAVPDVVWHSLSGAQEVLDPLGFTVHSDDVLEDRTPFSAGNWIVVGQSPAPGTVTDGQVSLRVIKDDDVADALGVAPPTSASRIGYAVQVDRQQLEVYAIASSEEADFTAEAAACAERMHSAYDELLLEGFGEVYCWLFRNPAAFEYANVAIGGGGMDRICWAATAGVAQAGAPNPPAPTVTENDLGVLVADGCP